MSPNVPMQSLLDAEGAIDPARDPNIDPKVLLRIYDHMLLLRALDGRMMNLQRQGRIGFYGTALGEEASTLGSAAAVRDTDWVFPALRQGGVLLYRGFPLEAFIAQLIGNSGDVLNGHQMPCHYADRGVNVVAWSSCIATQLPHAVGMAWAARHRKSDDIAVAYLGDGATSSPDFHAAMNFAGVWKAPVVFVCHNNHWAISVPVEAQTAVKEIVRKAARALTGADGATFVLRDNGHCYYADEDAIEPLWKGKRFPMGLCISGWVMLNCQPTTIEDIYSDPRIPADAYRPTFVKSLAMVPIRTRSPSTRAPAPARMSRASAWRTSMPISSSTCSDCRCTASIWSSERIRDGSSVSWGWRRFRSRPMSPMPWPRPSVTFTAFAKRKHDHQDCRALESDCG